MDFQTILYMPKDFYQLMMESKYSFHELVLYKAVPT